jgi:hypothetical protein
MELRTFFMLAAAEIVKVTFGSVELAQPNNRKMSNK